MNSSLEENLFSKEKVSTMQGSHARSTTKEPKRVILTAKVLPETKKRIDNLRNKKSIGKLLDECIGEATPPPPGWGADEMTRFLKIATENGYATHVREKKYWPKIEDIDELTFKISQNLDNNREWFISLFFYRFHSVWRAAVRLAISGQGLEAQILLRAAIENALIALFIFNDSKEWKDTKSRFMIWMNRENSKKDLTKCRNEFQSGSMLKELAATDKGLAKIAKVIYDDSIEHGAHPNVHGLLGNIQMSEDGKNKKIETLYLNCEGQTFHFALKRACQTALCALLIFKIIFKERFDIMGFSDEIEKVKKGL